MPTVPKYGQPAVRQNALPGVRKSSSAETFESAGGTVAQGQEQLARARQGVGAAVAALGATGFRVAATALQVREQVREREQQKADQVAQLTWERQLDEIQHRLITDPEKGALTVKGKDTLPLRQTVLEAFDEQTDSMFEGLTNDQQRIAFERARDNRRGRIGEALDDHTLRQMAAYEQGETKALLESTVNMARANAGNPREVANQLARQEAIVQQHAGALGVVGEEAKKGLISDLRNQTWEGAISQQLADGNDKGAKVYFEEARDAGHLTGESLTRMAKAVNEGSITGEAQRQSDAIVNAGGTLAQQREKAKAITDPDVRAQTLALVEHEGAVVERQQRDDHETLLQRAAQTVEKTGSFLRVSAGDRAQMTLGELSAFHSYEKQLRENGDVDTDLPTYYGLMQQASTDPEGFVNVNLLSKIDKLGKTEFKQLTDLQGQIRRGQGAQANDALDGYRTTAAIVDDTLRQVGIDTGSSKDNPDVARVSQFRRTVDEKLQALQRLTGKKATSADTQQVVDDLLKSVTLEKSSWWNPFSSDVAKRKFEMTVGDVPTNERTSIEQELRAQQLAVTDDRILLVYWRRQARGAK